MSNRKTNHIEAIAEGAVKTYKAIEEGVVGTYRKMEQGIVGAFEKVEDACVEKLFTKDGETVEEAKERLKQGKL